MSWIDIVIIVVVVLSSLAGLKEGAVRMVCGLAGLVLGVFLAGRFGSTLSQAFFPDAQSWGILAYVIIFIVVAVGAGIAGAILSKIVQSTMLAWVDRLVGVIAGALSGLLTVIAVLAALTVFAPDAADLARQSGFGAFLLSMAPLLLAFLPKDALGPDNIVSGIGV